MRIYGTIELIESDVTHRLGKCTMEFAKSKQNQIHEHNGVITLLWKKSHLENKEVKEKPRHNFGHICLCFSFILMSSRELQQFSYFSQ